MISSVYPLTLQTYLLSYPLVLGELYDGLDVLICQRTDGQLVVLLCDVVGLDHRGKHRESVRHVQGTIVVVVVDTCQLLQGETKKLQSNLYYKCYFHFLPRKYRQVL